MHVVDGHIRDANMNYVCAAGTGSFVEEQANKLGYKVVGSRAGRAGPAAAARHRPLHGLHGAGSRQLIRTASTPQEALAAVMVSVVKNYLNKVVGNRYRSREKIFFQGATARNPALVAAFERLLGVEIVVSPYCHVMGAFGVALLDAPRDAGAGAVRQRFRGLDLDKRDITLRRRPASSARTTARSRSRTSRATRARRGATCAAASRASAGCASRPTAACCGGARSSGARPGAASTCRRTRRSSASRRR